MRFSGVVEDAGEERLIKVSVNVEGCEHEEGKKGKTIESHCH